MSLSALTLQAKSRVKGCTHENQLASLYWYSLLTVSQDIELLERVHANYLSSPMVSSFFYHCQAVWRLWY